MRRPILAAGIAIVMLGGFSANVVLADPIPVTPKVCTGAGTLYLTRQTGHSSSDGGQPDGSGQQGKKGQQGNQGDGGQQGNQGGEQRGDQGGGGQQGQEGNEVDTSSYAWDITGGGACQQREQIDPANSGFGLPAQGLIASFIGHGTSGSIGICSAEPAIAVDNLNITVMIRLTDASGRTTTEMETWSAPATTFPLLTLFVISGPNAGAGTIFSHIFLQCGNDGGKPSAQFDWVEVL